MATESPEGLTAGMDWIQREGCRCGTWLALGCEDGSPPDVFRVCIEDPSGRLVLYETEDCDPEKLARRRAAVRRWNRDAMRKVGQ